MLLELMVFEVKFLSSSKFTFPSLSESSIFTGVVALLSWQTARSHSSCSTFGLASCPPRSGLSRSTLTSLQSSTAFFAFTFTFAFGFNFTFFFTFFTFTLPFQFTFTPLFFGHSNLFCLLSTARNLIKVGYFRVAK